MTQTLSDLELSRRLRALGVDVGPITSTTRDVYVRKYRALQAQQKPPPAATTPPPLHRPTRASPLLHRPPRTSPRQHHVPTTPPHSPPAPATPPPEHIAPPPATVDLNSPGRDTEDTAAAAVVGRLLLSFDNWQHVASDTAFLFPSGKVIVASRAILATQCSKMIPILYNTEVPYSVNVMTLSGQSSQFMVRSEEVVRDLKEKICLIHSIPVPQQRLVFKQQELPDSSTFRSLQILSGATVHLVLVAAEVNSTRPTSTSYTCTDVTPAISIHHFTIGLSSEQLACFTETPPLQEQATPLQSPVQQLTAPRVSLPSHITHLVHAHDTCYSGFRMFLWSLYGRKSLQHESASNGQCSSYIMCYILGAYFELPELVGACISAIGSCLTVESARTILEFSKSIQSEALQQLCIQYMNTHNSTI